MIFGSFGLCSNKQIGRKFGNLFLGGMGKDSKGKKRKAHIQHGAPAHFLSSSFAATTGLETDVMRQKMDESLLIRFHHGGR